MDLEYELRDDLTRALQDFESVSNFTIEHEYIPYYNEEGRLLHEVFDFVVTIYIDTDKYVGDLITCGDIESRLTHVDTPYTFTYSIVKM